MASEKNNCKTLTKAGKPCRAAATEGGLCFFHANPNKASELGRIEGRRNRQAALENVDELPTLDSAMAVRNVNDRVITEIYSGKRSPGCATALASLLNLQLRAIEVTDLERRVAKLENAAKQCSDIEQGELPQTVISH
jgi:hypothetical protein